MKKNFSAVTKDTRLAYYLHENNMVSLRIYPKNIKPAIHRENIHDRFEINQIRKIWKKYNFPASHPENIVQVKIAGDDYPNGFSQGITMRNSFSTVKMTFAKQEIIKEKRCTRVDTYLNHPLGIIAKHVLKYHEKDSYLTIQTEIINQGKAPRVIEMLASFSLDGLSPFQPTDGAEQLYLHRFRSFWSIEGRHEAVLLEDLQLEPSWTHYGVRSLRFGQVGSMPSRGYFPFLAIEDRQNNCFWGAQLAWPGSWQMEAYRKDDFVAISGGLADREFGHWTKTLQPGENIVSPEAILTTCTGNDIYAITQRLIEWQMNNSYYNKTEKKYPVIFNDWTINWGDPDEKKLHNITKKLENKSITYLVIDDGWFKKKGNGFVGPIGDWEISRDRFPAGFEKTADNIREKSMIPGLWFEFENVTPESKLYEKYDMLLQRDAIPITVSDGNGTGMTRRFLDFRLPGVISYLEDKVIGTLKKYNIGYLKIDYNDTIGIGADGNDSLGESSREHLLAVMAFIKKIRKEIPGLTIECCSAGGHRIEPAMISLTDMVQFSDAHECIELPVVSANMHFLVLPSKLQLWAVLRAGESLHRTYYSLAATFLGRICFSGDLDNLSPKQWSAYNKALAFYQQVIPVLREGTSQRHGTMIKNYRHPSGWQAITRFRKNNHTALCVIHTFKNGPGKISIPLEGNWQLNQKFAEINLEIRVNKTIEVEGLNDFQGLAVLIEKIS